MPKEVLQTLQVSIPDSLRMCGPMSSHIGHSVSSNDWPLAARMIMLMVTRSSVYAMPEAATRKALRQ